MILYQSKVLLTFSIFRAKYFHFEGLSWSWSHGSWIYNYLCNQYLSPLKLFVRITLRRGVLDTTLGDKVCQWLTAGRWVSLRTPVSSTNKTDLHDITEILLKVELIIITLTLILSFWVVQASNMYRIFQATYVVSKRMESFILIRLTVAVLLCLYEVCLIIKYLTFRGMLLGAKTT
jgi:hypothetical protein